MSAVLDPPETIFKLSYGGIKPKPRWILTLKYDDRKTIEEIKEVLEKVMPHIGIIRITQICEELPKKRSAVLFRGERETAERYCDQLRERELTVRVDPEF